MNLNVLPLATEPGVSPDGLLSSLVRFRQCVIGLISSTQKGNILTLPFPNSFLFDSIEPTKAAGNEMFVRDVFPKLVSMIDDAVDSPVHPFAVLITGTPGVGSTVLRNYYLRHLLLKQFTPTETVRTIVLHGSVSSRFFRIVMRRSDEVAVSADNTPIQVSITVSIDSELNRNTDFDGNIYQLVNVFDGADSVDPPRRFREKVVCFSSASRQFDVFLKFMYCQMLIYHLPLWTLPELHASNSALELGVAAAVLEARYEQVGGVFARVLKDSEQNYDHYIKDVLGDAVRAVNLHKIVMCKGAAAVDTIHPSSHLLVYYVVRETSPGEYDLRHADRRWGSTYIERLAEAEEVRRAAEKARQAIVYRRMFWGEEEEAVVETTPPTSVKRKSSRGVVKSNISTTTKRKRA